MATCRITGTITNASGAGFAGAEVKLQPQPRSEGLAAVQGGNAIAGVPVVVSTGAVQTSGSQVFADAVNTAVVAVGAQYAGLTVEAQLSAASPGSATTSATGVVDATGNLTLTLNQAPGTGQSATVAYAIGVGDFAIDAVQGFNYLIDIPVLGYSFPFRCPALPTIRFDLLDLVPNLEPIADTVNADGETALQMAVAVANIEATRERFDQLVVQQSDTGSFAGSYSDVQTFVLETEKDTYDFTRTTDGATAPVSGSQVFADTTASALISGIGVPYAGLNVVTSLSNPSAGSLAASATGAVDSNGDLTLALDQAPGAGESVTVDYTVNPTGIVTTEPARFYRAQFRNSVNGDAGPFSEPRLANTPDYNSLFSIEDLKQIYLFGVKLTDQDGTPYPDRLFEFYIEAAIDWVETSLNIAVNPVDIVAETHDHYSQDYSRWGYFQTRKYPVQRIDRFAFQYPSQPSEVVLPSSFIQLLEEGSHGAFNIVPGQGSIADILFIPGQLLPLWSGRTGRIPNVWKVSYRAGFEPGTVPPLLLDLIGLKAAIGVLNIAGDLIAGAGIANLSISVPGLSQNVGTTSSATNSGYGARIIQYNEQVKEKMKLAREFWRGLPMVVV